ncbi:MAG: sigma-54 dependent transcriptional regulator [Thermodesulfovibrio sp.]|jgi:DNA-binding NtrC family response regulator|uniref:sigma-54-dependent transcriptional regulator n=1 Tax=unclassified Thermodesulfovibrio TaxID=2645936 RepID=UPI000839FB71|nr:MULTISPECIES: sigma-54 dependent transcriptional regulator [unclassified Thermodesulfovibrio]MDI1472138.1 sigma-54 dependent transcriptional regulator [Thermodesulfovibrio sp. 1176]MDI6715231.1 sigma-54 dependent transcriptional regulator [Thermodesulfovibrio sp.]ODA45112.1 Response regulator of zinc sigma-54-dependent two-component system [Thermodesulfovibrio sp. N1]
MAFLRSFNVLVISEEADKLYRIFDSIGITFRKSNKAKSSSKDFSNYDIAFLDIDSEGWEKRLNELKQYMPVIAFGKQDIKKAVEAMKLGAIDFLQKPLKNDAVFEIFEKFKDKPKVEVPGLIGISRIMEDVYCGIRKAALTDSNVLITGESGTGKELVARAIHNLSERKDNPFIVINCSAIPDTLLESELFGFEKGAFTGANYTKKGLIEWAHHGTLFFDEIGDVSPLFQTKILRVIQEGEFIRIGGAQPIKVDVRFIAATNKDLLKACKEGSFREDLFYRLNVIHIELPPLRNRKEDIPSLVDFFIKKHSSKRKDIYIKGITEEALNLLMNYSFPGNVRELENIIERAIAFTNSAEITVKDLPSYLIKTSTTKKTMQGSLREAVDNFEKELIWSALQKSRGNISKAAEFLGIHRQQLQRKLKQFKIAT